MISTCIGLFPSEILAKGLLVLLDQCQLESLQVVYVYFTMIEQKELLKSEMIACIEVRGQLIKYDEI